jgi:hypothetical protein
MRQIAINFLIITVLWCISYTILDTLWYSLSKDATVIQRFNYNLASAVTTIAFTVGCLYVLFGPFKRKKEIV